MTPKQRRFVAEYLKDLNATEAAIRAGYSAKSARFHGSRLLADRNISQHITEKTATHLAKVDIKAEDVLREYGRVAFIDMRTFFDAQNNLKAISELDDAQGAALASLEVVIKNVAAGDGKTDLVHKFKLWDKMKALESLAKHFGLLVDKVEHSGELVIQHMDLNPEESTK